MPESRGETFTFNELEASEWLSQTLFFLRGYRGYMEHVSGGETRTMFGDRVTADWIAVLPNATRRVWDKLEESGTAARIPCETHHSLRTDIESCDWAVAEPAHRLFAFFLQCRASARTAHQLEDAGTGGSRCNLYRLANRYRLISRRNPSDDCAPPRAVAAIAGASPSPEPS